MIYISLTKYLFNNCCLNFLNKVCIVIIISDKNKTELLNY